MRCSSWRTSERLLGEAAALEHGRVRGHAVQRQAHERPSLVVGADLGVDGQSAELAERYPLPVRQLLEAAGEEGGGVGAGGEVSPVDEHLEAVAAGVLPAADRAIQCVDAVREGACAVLGAGDCVPERVLGALPGALQARQAHDFGVGAGFVEDQRIAGGERFDLGETQGVLADVLDLAHVQAPAHYLADEAGLALDCLPAVGVETALDRVAVDCDLRVLVALAHAAAFALLDVRGPPRTVEVMDRDAPVLDVGADPHLLGGADQNGDVPGAAGGEQAGLLGVVAGLVDEPDLLGWHATGGQQLA